MRPHLFLFLSNSRYAARRRRRRRRVASRRVGASYLPANFPFAELNRHEIGFAGALRPNHQKFRDSLAETFGLSIVAPRTSAGAGKSNFQGGGSFFIEGKSSSGSRTCSRLNFKANTVGLSAWDRCTSEFIHNVTDMTELFTILVVRIRYLYTNH